MRKTINLDDMRLFAEVASCLSFSAAATRIGVPKQTLSRRVAELEAALETRLLHRTTRRLHLTEVGAAYARRCTELLRLAEDANRTVLDAEPEPRGVLKITADPVFGEAFLAPLITRYAKKWPNVGVDVMLTRRRVSLVEEGFDLAFRVGSPGDPSLSATKLGPARVLYCASRSYVKRRGKLASPNDLAKHECVLVVTEGEPERWPFPGKKGLALYPVTGRVRVNSFKLAHEAAREGLGIAIFPEFSCKEDLEKKRLVSVFAGGPIEVGAVWMVHPAASFLTARVRTFITLARAELR